MNLLVADPVLQTCIVGAFICLMASAITVYLWSQDRSERYLLYWSLAWAVSGLRWAIHYPAEGDAALRAFEGIALPVTLLLLVLGSYELLPIKPWKRGPMTWISTAFFAVYGLVAYLRGVSIEAAYAIYVAVLGFAAFCMLRAYQVQRLTGYLFGIISFVWQAAVVAATLYWLGRALSDHLIVPLVYNTAMMISIVVIKFQRNLRRLRESERTMQKIFETAPAPIVITRPPKGEIERGNSLAFDMLNLSAESSIGKTTVDKGVILDEDARQSFYAELEAGRRITGAEMVINRAGEKRTLSVYGDRLELADGTRYIFSFYDLTELRRAEQELRTAAEEMRRLYVRLANVEDDERRVLHAELHDQVGANLSALRLELDVTANLLSRNDSPSAQRHLNSAREVASETIAMARNLMAELRPPALDDYGLLAGLRTFAELQSSRLNLPIHVRGEDLAPRPSSLVEGALFRIAHEAVINAARHASATRVTVTVGECDGRVILTVEDDGAGFEPQAPGTGPDHWGLKNMRERARAIGGTLSIETAPGAGTRIMVEAPREPPHEVPGVADKPDH